MLFDATIFHKLVFPAISFPFLAGVMIFVGIEDGLWWSLMFVPVVALSVWFFVNITIPLKRVRVVGEALEISDLRRGQATIPLHRIKHIEDVWRGRPWVRRIIFTEPTPFGMSVVYMPPFRYGFIQHDWPELQNIRAN